MFTLFPSLLFLTPLAITFLRIVTGIFFIYLAVRLITTSRTAVLSDRFPIVGPARPWMVDAAAITAAAIGVLLCVGVWTQAVAILGALMALKHLIATRWTTHLPYARGTYVLLMVLCTSFVVTGASVFGFDLPL